MYLNDDLTHRTKPELIAIIKEVHAAMCGLLWQIEDMRNFDEILTESHFDDTVPMDRAQYVHRILMTHNIDKLVSAEYLNDERDEFDKWIDRCDVHNSFVGAEEVFSR